MADDLPDLPDVPATASADAGGPVGEPRDPGGPGSGAGSDDDALVRRVLSGQDPDLALLAARGVLPLPPERLIPLQVRLAESDEEAVAERAAESLRGTELRVVDAFLARSAGPDTLRWFARHRREPALLSTILRRRDVPRALLVELAPRLPPELQEALVLRQDAIVEEPGIVDALESNPDLTPYARRRLAEYRQHLVPRERRATRPVGGADEDDDDDADRLPGEATRAEVLAAVEEASQKPRGGEEDPTSGLTEAQIRFLPMPVRLRLTRGASRALRSILIRDPNPNIALSVMRNNRFSESEIENIAQNRNIDSDILAEIAKEREWMSKYRIVHSLVQNPRTPLALAVKLVARLSVRDLRMLSRDRNVADAVRSTARRLYTIKRV